MVAGNCRNAYIKRMKEIIKALLEDFWGRPLPAGIVRGTQFRSVPGAAETVMGMRRAGKTWFCLQHIRALVAKGLPIESVLHLNFEDDRLQPFGLADFQTALDVFYRSHPSFKEKRCVMFLDEIQQVPEWERFVRRVLDTENMEVILSGSSSKLLSRELATMMRGRSIGMEIFPFSFAEHLAASQLSAPDPDARGSKMRAVMERAFLDYMERGGFPDARGLDDDLRRQRLQGYVDSVVLRDIIERHNVTDTLTVRALVRHLLYAPGRTFSVNKFFNGRKSQGIPCTKSQVSAHLAELADAYLVYTVPIHTLSEAVRRVNPVKVYAVDTGLLRAFSPERADLGPLLENIIYLHLRRHNAAVEYYVAESGRETDFLYRHPETGKPVLVQVCWSMSDPDTRLREVTALDEAMRETGIKRATIITAFDEISDDLPRGVTVTAAWRWLLRAELQ